jgi:hypothetical protein
MDHPGWLDALERRFGGWAIPHLLRGLVVLNALTFLLDLSSQGFVQQLLLTRPELLQGEYWRLLTFLFAKAATPGIFGMVFFLFWMFFTWMIGDALEGDWGSFKLTFYILLPVLLLGGIVWTGVAPSAPSFYIFTSLFFAFATHFPDYEIFLFPLPIPLKVKWIAWVGAGFVLVDLVLNLGSAPVILASLSSYLLFFTGGWIGWFRLRAQTRAHRRRFHGDE